MKQELFTLTGMSCSACAARVHKAVSEVAGVQDVSVNLLKNSMIVHFEERAISAEAIVQAVARAGYGATRCAAAASGKPPLPSSGDGEAGMLLRRFISSLGFTLCLCYVASGNMLGLPLPACLSGREHLLPLALTQLLLTLPVMIINGRLYRNGVHALRTGAPNMDSLIALGSGAALFSGIYALYGMAFALGAHDAVSAAQLGQHLYFESAAMIPTLITLGKFFEARAKGKTSDALARLAALAPQTATVRRDGKEDIIPREDVRTGDLVVVRAGESLPVDGVVLEGRGLLDESSLTGESMPQEKTAGSHVTGATINTAGYFVMRATRVGKDTTLAQIIALVDEATSTKAPIARLADTISGIFVPTVILIAVGTAACWLLLGRTPAFALEMAISVLVISCPCALGLATPTAIMVGAGRGAAFGILFKSASAMENAGRIETVVLDKTGTVTAGQPVVTDILPAAGISPEALLRVAASLEQRSEHPLAAAIMKAAALHDISSEHVEQFFQIPGAGIGGMLHGERIIAGNAALLHAEGVENTLEQTGIQLAEAGKTALYCARNGILLGVLAVSDPVREDSAQAVATLQSMGLDVLMLTGDTARTAEAVRRQTGIDRVIADVLPQDKEREIRKLQEAGQHVAMIGDGINDAPALARADAGIAIGTGTDIAVESADLVLMKSSLLDAATAMQLSRAVLRTIRQNLFWAFFYNSVGIPVAAGMFSSWGIQLSPAIAAAAMSFSSFSVVSNALRLRLFVPRHTGDTVRHRQHDEIATRSQPMKKIISIQGMNCGHCTSSVEKALRALDGVRNATADLLKKQAVVELEHDMDNSILEKAVVDAGFTVTGIR
ncbi:MAG: heavy metal translocating P-type ATPase [Desulfovibrionaceae bacterium]|nr:heavy metal translocating P-type ATPase [Desulfovibrionaceae bacterium]